MARTSVSRKVARAAATGGGRTSGRRRPMMWYGTLALIVVVGVVLVGVSRHQYLNPSSTAGGGPPTKTDSWRTAFGFDSCGVALANPAKVSSGAGIFTKGDGIIYVQPGRASHPADYTGHNATLGKFVSGYPGMKLSSTELGYPGKAVQSNGEMCGSQPGKVQVKIWNNSLDNTGHLVSGDPSKLLLQNGQLITMAFVPAGVSIPQPSSTSALAAPAPSTGSSPSATTSTGSAPATSAPATGAPATSPPASSAPAAGAPPATSKAPTTSR